MIGRVVILTGNHLCNNPRVIKEAGTLARAGYDVTVLGAWLDRGFKNRDQKIIRSAPFAEAERAGPVCPMQLVGAGLKLACTSSSALRVEHYRCGEQDQNFVHLLEGAHDIAGLAADLPHAHPCDRGGCED